MVEIGSTIMYRDEVCTVKDIVERYKNDEDYFVFVSASDPSLTIHVPTKSAQASIRTLMSAKDIDCLIKNIAALLPIEVLTGNRGQEYKDLLHNGSQEGLALIIKTSFLRQHDHGIRKQKVSENDKIYLRQAERLLYNEISASLGISYDEAKQRVMAEVSACLQKAGE